MSELRKAAEMALETLERLDGWLALRYGNELTPPEREVVKALRQALAQPVDAVNMSQERVDETVKREHEPVAWLRPSGEIVVRTDYGGRLYYSEQNVYTAPPKKEWVGLTDEQVESIGEDYAQDRLETIEEAIFHVESLLKEKNSV